MINNERVQIPMKAIFCHFWHLDPQMKGDPLKLFWDPLGTKMAKKRPSKRQPKNLSPKMLPKNALPLNIAPEIPRL